ncbi:MAG: UdgX family uracil-DNA binding protein [Candidatus Binatia bacterium]
MKAERSASDFLPERPSLPRLRAAAAGCRGCDLYRRATQTVFGEGPASAELLFVGEQPGDREDVEGAPFVGPAGRLLDRAMEDARIPRKLAYVTNAVKHFKWVPRGKRRIHEKPGTREIRACRPWLEAEIAVVQPRVIVCMGATAAQALMGPKFRLTQHRGEALESPWPAWIVATVHPSAILQAPDDESRREAYEAFVEDLGVARDSLERRPRELAWPSPAEAHA